MRRATVPRPRGETEARQRRVGGSRLRSVPDQSRCAELEVCAGSPLVTRRRVVTNTWMKEAKRNPNRYAVHPKDGRGANGRDGGPDSRVE